LVPLAGCPGSGEPGQQPRVGEPGGPPSVEGPRPRGNLQSKPVSSVVLAAGGAPDGARFEFVARELRRAGWVRSTARGFRAMPEPRMAGCALWFESVRSSSPAAPCARPCASRTLRSKSPAPHTSARIRRLTSSWLGSLARTSAGVRVVYDDEEGETREAPVHIARVMGALRQRAGADESFGLYLVFPAAIDSLPTPDGLLPRARDVRSRSDRADRLCAAERFRRRLRRAERTLTWPPSRPLGRCRSARQGRV
jgi:hypothetical protein